jgi:hypothetical protein
MKTYAEFGIEMDVNGNDVAVSVGEHKDGQYVPHQTYRCRVATGYQWLTPERVAGSLRSELTMAVSREERFDFRASLDRIADENLAGRYALAVV